MHDWMISKKRYWGLALPIYDCAACGTFDVIGGREELRERAVEGWDAVRGPHAASPVRGRGQDRLLRLRRARSRASATSAIPGSTRASCRSRRCTTARTRSYWEQWFPADFITESFPGQFRNWFYSMLAMSTVLRREPPFKTIFGYATLFGEDGRPMHKSWGNAIEFDEAAERMGVDVMRWMYRQRPAGGQHPVRLARGGRGAARAAGPVERVRVLRDVRAPGRLGAERRRGRGRESADGGPPLDRWILSRAAGLAAAGSRTDLARLRRARRRDARSTASSRTCRRGTCALADRMRLSRTTTRPIATRPSRRSTSRSWPLARILAPILPFLVRVDVPEPRRGRRTADRAPDRST